MNELLKLMARLAAMTTPHGAPEVHVSRSVVMRLILIIMGLLLVAPPEAQAAGAEAVNRVLDEMGQP